MTPAHPAGSYSPGLHRFTILTACATVFLIFAGGMVTSTGSGLSVPHWPLSYGMVMPPMVGGIFYEHGHRMIATAVGLLTTIQALWLWRAEPRAWMRRLGALAWLLVVAQGVLGGMTVLFKLPIAISVLHACTAQLFLCIAVALAVFTSRGWIEGTPRVEGAEDLRIQRASAMVAIALFLQLVIGAVMRHSGAGLAVIHFPVFGGGEMPPLTHYTGVHLLHRYWGSAVCALVLLSAVRTIVHPRTPPRLTGIAMAMGLTVILQVGLGVMTILSFKRPDVTSLHVATGATLLALTVCLTLFARRTLPATEPAPEAAPGRLAEGASL